jgi:hypothetical protein
MLIRIISPNAVFKTRGNKNIGTKDAAPINEAKSAREKIDMDVFMLELMSIKLIIIVPTRNSIGKTSTTEIV